MIKFGCALMLLPLVIFIGIFLWAVHPLLGLAYIAFFGLMVAASVNANL